MLDSSNNAQLVLLTTDLFFTSKIQGPATHLGFRVKIVSSQPGLDSFDLNQLAGVIVDLELPGLDFARLSETIHTHAVKFIGYGSHVKTNLFDSAREAGIGLLYSRGEISSKLPEILNQLR